MEIYVCIGSSCHLKGSYPIINALKELIAQNHLEEKVQLNGSFCLGHCQDGVSAKFDGEIVTGLSVDNIGEIFRERVLARLGGE
ncbi:MAG: NAD(P)H-dependent oxidoreductase subunit E [Oscillospiraceae bacterium]